MRRATQTERRNVKAGLARARDKSARLVNDVDVASMFSRTLTMTYVKTHSRLDQMRLNPAQWTLVVRRRARDYDTGVCYRDARRIVVTLGVGATKGRIARLLVHEIAHILPLDHHGPVWQAEVVRVTEAAFPALRGMWGPATPAKTVEAGIRHHFDGAFVTDTVVPEVDA